MLHIYMHIKTTTINQLTPMPPVTGRDEPWQMQHAARETRSEG